MLRILASPSGRLAPDLGCESHPLRCGWDCLSGRAGRRSRVEAAVFRVVASPSGRLAPDLGCESHPLRYGWDCLSGRAGRRSRVEAAVFRVVASPSGRLAPDLGCEFPPRWWVVVAQPISCWRRRSLPGRWRSFSPLRCRKRWLDCGQGLFGRVAEWLKAHDWKSCGRTPTWVRIPPRPLRAEPAPDGLGFEPRVEPVGASRPRLAFGPLTRTSAANPTPSAAGGTWLPSGLGERPRVEPAVLRILGSPSGRLAPDLGCESHPVRWWVGLASRAGRPAAGAAGN